MKNEYRHHPKPDTVATAVVEVPRLVGLGNGMRR